MEIYSQNEEQKIISDYFGDFIGTFCDLGANEGTYLSNTYALVQKQWKGLMVEASPKAYKRLIDNLSQYKDHLHCLDVAVGTYDGEIEFYESGELLGKGDTSLVSSVKKEELERWKPINMPFEKIIVPIHTWDWILNKSKYKKFNLFSIDIEGMEKEVVPQIDFNALDTKMAIIEWNGKDAYFFDNLMSGFDFTLHYINGENRIYTK